MKASEAKRTHHTWYWFCFLVLILIAYVIWVFQFSYPSLKPNIILSSFVAKSNAGVLPWPSYGQAAVGVDGYGIVASSGKQTPVPMASTAKLITALAVLQKYPISNVNASPEITLSQADVDIYNAYSALGGSVVAVVAGEKISEFQMLEAMLLPSANNMADSLAVWAFGSLSNYSAYANNYLKAQYLLNTHVGIDASGFDPSTTSTASDLIRMGEIIVADSVIGQIVIQKTVSGIPVVDTIKNVNGLLGTDNIVGIKTGNTAQAGGVYLSESIIVIDKLPYYITTAVMGSPSLWQAMNDSLKLVEAAQGNFEIPQALSVIKKGTLIGYYSVPWSKSKIRAEADSNLPLVIWKGNSVNVSVMLKSISHNTKSGSIVGKISAEDNRFNSQWPSVVRLTNSVPQPSRWWLLLHPIVSLQL